MDAHEGSWNRGRLALVAVAVTAMLMLALPASALAKTVTRLVVATNVTVDNGDPLATAWPHGLTVKLQKKVSKTRYAALSGTVKVYRYDLDDKAYHLVMSRKGSTISFPMPDRGKYKFVYSGNSSTKSSTAYSTLFEDIGFGLTPTGFGTAAVPGSPAETMITLTYAVDWNTNAWDAPVWFGSEMDFGGTESFDVYYERRLQEPGTVEFTFKIDNSEIEAHLYDDAWAYVSLSDDPYIIESPDLQNVRDMSAPL
jgi:hypothetical protein